MKRWFAASSPRQLDAAGRPVARGRTGARVLGGDDALRHGPRRWERKGSLALEGIYLDLEALCPDSRAGLPARGRGCPARRRRRALLPYDRLALSEAVLDRVHDGFRLLVYSEFRRRYEDRAWNRLLEPARAALTSLTQQQLKSLERSLGGVKQRIEAITTMCETRANEPR